jgi:hypothetical protein
VREAAILEAVRMKGGRRAGGLRNVVAAAAHDTGIDEVFAEVIDVFDHAALE